MITKDVFSRSRPDFSKLETYGFRPDRDVLRYSDVLPGEQFRAELDVAKDGSVTGRVIDLDTGEEYLPIRIEAQSGGFVGQVREDFRAFLERVRDACFLPVSFMFDQANRIEGWIHRTCGVTAEFPWEKYPGNGTFKCRKNGKWFAAILTVEYGKLGDGAAASRDAAGASRDGAGASRDAAGASRNGAAASHDAAGAASAAHDADEVVEVINLKADPDAAPELARKPGIYPAWHMNKKHWISVILDDTLSDDEVQNLVRRSYALASEGKGTKVRSTGAWMIPSNPALYDVDAGFRRGGGEIEWHQHNQIRAGDEVYIYSSAPNSALLYRCEVVAADLPYRGMFKDSKGYKCSMRIRLIEKYPPDKYPLSFIKAHGGSVVRSARTMPKELYEAIRNTR